MNKPMTQWNQTPLMHAGINVINTPVKTTALSPCSGFMPRYNVGNIHEIKNIWSVPAHG
ncbi:hypothetical protein SAMN04489798_3610 [Pseudomonas arsenicoxydans]|uniref:Uncharacterized protein n=1 Tax=Pseudomonas arsenicoxydans TaxID=702115 RepID=A0A1H0LNN9_9PSED|nr:hypothetical protein [Pseudomonas arsenicoxydans]SDO69774.1 hypothetical protein SAMN04489798_3610 [Pseudomonas arsenicoxydans]